MRLSKLNKSFGILSLIAASALLSGCDMALLDPKGQIGLEQRSLILTALGLMLIVVIPVIVMTIVFTRKFRASNTLPTGLTLIKLKLSFGQCQLSLSLSSQR